MRRACTTVVALGMLATGGRAGAQVGYPPARSPYVDLTYTQEVALLAGYYVGRDDPAGVVPGNGSLIGLRYAWRAGGPAHLTAKLARIDAQRRVIDPTKPPATRDRGLRDWPLYTLDAGLAMSLTGAKSWHHFVPEIQAGLGAVSDLRGKADTGGFKYGTRFAITWGAAMRYTPGGRWQVRADLSNRLSSIKYPDSYYVGSSGVPPVLQGIPKSVWRNNPSVTIGLSYLFSR